MTLGRFPTPDEIFYNDLQRTIAQARNLSAYLRAARNAAPDGDKAGLRLANNRVEQAIAALAKAAEVKL